MKRLLWYILSGFFTATACAADIAQWAVSAEATTQYSAGSWSAAQATGAANVAACGDSGNAWCPSTDAPVQESLLLTYQFPVYAGGVSVHETYTAPFVTGIAYIEPNGTVHLIWQGTDTTACNGWLTVTHPQTTYLVKQVRVITAKPGYEEIDAVKLTGMQPSDTTAPAVSITSPASGQAVSGSITVSSNASDNIGVVGVQFKVDGVHIDVEDTAAPYSISYNTVVLTNGTHTLTAVARDAAGNTKTSAGVSITVSNSPAGGPIAYGQTLNGSISAANEKDEFSFSGITGEVITVRFVKTSGTINYVTVDLINPSGATVTSSYSGVITATLAAAGTFKLRARDYYNTNTGTYAISLQRTKNPAGAAAFTFGHTVSENNIDMPAKMAAYTFSVNANDTITVRFARTSGFIQYLNVELYNPAGALLTSSYGGSFDQNIPSAGNCTVLVTDYYRLNTGTYSLSIQRANNPGSATAIAFGQTWAGDITSCADMETYTINATANDTITIRTAATNTTSGSFSPNIELYHPTGTKIISSSSAGIDQKVNATGRYTVLATDYYRDGTGTYEATFQRTNNPANKQILAFNTIKEEIIDRRTALDVYQFNVTANATLTFCSAVKNITSGFFDCFMELYTSNGTKMAGGSSFQYKPAYTGPMYLFFSDYYRDGAGVYRFMGKNANVSCYQIDLSPPSIAVVNPVAGDMVGNGAIYPITWAAADNVGITWQELRLSTDSGATWPTVIATNVNGTLRSYTWPVPGNLTTSSARLKVIARDAAGNENNATTGGDFMIANVTIAGPAATYSYDEVNRLAASNATVYEYDATGNRVLHAR